MGANTFFSMTTRWLRQGSLNTVMKARGDESLSGKMSMIKNSFAVNTVSLVFPFRQQRKVLTVPTNMVGKQVNTVGTD